MTDTLTHVRTETTASVIQEETRYQHRDHLGSIDIVTDRNGNIEENLAYDPFGSRRENDWSGDIGPTAQQQVEAAATTTSRGFTGTSTSNTRHSST